ncbi:MAG TPA: glycosyltransferase [Candidatus Binatia bacterium]|nr:glycosyltransferase [Candidatus Binatia bacterium]
MIRIAFFAPILGTGGTQRHLQQVLRLLDPSRFAAEVITLRPGGEVEAELKGAGTPVTSLAIGARLTTPRAARALVRTAARLRASGVQVVHGYQWRPALVGALAGRLARVPLLLASKRSLTGDSRQARVAWKAIGRRVDTIVVNAEALRAEAEAHGTAARWALIPSGVELDRFTDVPAAADAKTGLGLDPRRPVVGTVGRLESRKGHADFLVAARAMLALANGLRPQLLIVGDGPLRAALGRQVEELGMAETVRFTGAVADVRGPLAAMDVFVLPSHAEGMSNALLEAMAARRAVVATAVGGTREVVDATNGVLVPPGDAEAMAGEVVRLLADPLRARRLGEAAQRRVADAFSAAAMVRRLEALYTERLGAGAA